MMVSLLTHICLTRPQCVNQENSRSVPVPSQNWNRNVWQNCWTTWSTINILEHLQYLENNRKSLCKTGCVCVYRLNKAISGMKLVTVFSERCTKQLANWSERNNKISISTVLYTSSCYAASQYSRTYGPGFTCFLTLVNTFNHPSVILYNS